MDTPPIQFPQKVVKRFVFVLVAKEKDRNIIGWADASTVEEALAHFVKQLLLDSLKDITRVLWIDVDDMNSIDDPHVLIAQAVTQMLAADNG